MTQPPNYYSTHHLQNKNRLALEWDFVVKLNSNQTFSSLLCLCFKSQNFMPDLHLQSNWVLLINMYSQLMPTGTANEF